MWQCLGGPYFGHVTLNNLRMLLLAIKGLHVRPDIEVGSDEPTIRMSEVLSTHDGKKKEHLKVPSFSDNLNHFEEMRKKDHLFGFFNQNGDFYMEPHDVDIAAKIFKPINQNRMLFEQENL